MWPFWRDQDRCSPCACHLSQARGFCSGSVGFTRAGRFFLVSKRWEVALIDPNVSPTLYTSLITFKKEFKPSISRYVPSLISPFSPFCNISWSCWAVLFTSNFDDDVAANNWLGLMTHHVALCKRKRDIIENQKKREIIFWSHTLRTYQILFIWWDFLKLIRAKLFNSNDKLDKKNENYIVFLGRYIGELYTGEVCSLKYIAKCP